MKESYAEIRQNRGLGRNRLSELTGIPLANFRYFEEGKTSTWDSEKKDKIEKVYYDLQAYDLRAYKMTGGHDFVWVDRVGEEKHRFLRTGRSAAPVGEALGWR